MGRRWLAIFMAAQCAWPPGWCAAHPAYLTAVEVNVEADGRFNAQLRFDTLAYTLNDTSARIGNEPMEALLAGPREELEETLTRAKGRLQRGFKIVTDTGDGTVDGIDFPDAVQVLAWRDEHQTVLPIVIPARLSGWLPPGSRTVACRFPSVLEQVILTVERPGEEAEAQAVEAGTTSTPLPVRLQEDAHGSTKQEPEAGTKAKRPVRAVGIISSGQLHQSPGLVISFCVLALLAALVWWARSKSLRPKA